MNKLRLLGVMCASLIASTHSFGTQAASILSGNTNVSVNHSYQFELFL